MLLRVIKRQNLSRPTVELRPSKIRREPPAPTAQQGLLPEPTEREAWTVILGVLMFGIAITIIILGLSDYTSR